MRVKEVMSKDVECAAPSDSLTKVAQRMLDLDIGALPVGGDADQWIGIVTDRDITVRGTAQGCDPNSTPVSSVMTPGIVSCAEDDQLEEAAHIMEQKQIRRLVVLNRKQRPVGILSLGDIAVKSHNNELSGEALEQISEPVGAGA